MRGGGPQPRMTRLLQALRIDLPIIQAPMAGVSTPAMAAAVSNAGALGSIGVGATDAQGARGMMAAVRERSRRPFNVNVFCHRPPAADRAVEQSWIEYLRPHFERFGAAPPPALREIYRSFVEDDAMLAALLGDKPHVVSFHFGLPSAERIRALRDAGIVLLASATHLAEARAAANAGVHAVVAQGYEAGGHRGIFDAAAADDPHAAPGARPRCAGHRGRRDHGWRRHRRGTALGRERRATRHRVHRLP
jgi:nitronate monooxygenase